MHVREKEIKKPVAIIVEGQDYYHFLIHSFGDSRLACFRDVCVYDYGGTSDLAEYLKTFRATTGFTQNLRAMGIIRDAESNADAAADSIRDSLRKNGFTVPLASNQVAVGVPHVAYLTMPHGQNSGCLEDACLAACIKVSEKECADAFLVVHSIWICG